MDRAWAFVVQLEFIGQPFEFEFSFGIMTGDKSQVCWRGGLWLVLRHEWMRKVTSKV